MTFKTFSLSNFQIRNTVLTICHTIHCYHQDLFHNWKFVPFDFLYPFPLLRVPWTVTLDPISGNQQCVLCIYALGFYLFKFYI